MAPSREDDIGPVDLTRRQWMATSAALVAGSLAACNTSRDGGSARSSQLSGSETARVALPSFDAQRRTDHLTSTVGPEEDRFAAWNEALRASAAGRESAFVDLDAVDHNLRLVGEQLGSRIGLRLCAKSLPSLQLLEYMMLAASTNRIMAFSEGMVRDLLTRFGSEVDILLGRPASVEACARTFATLDALGDGPNPVSYTHLTLPTKRIV